MKICLECVEQHTQECFLRTADHIETCPDTDWIAAFLPYRKRWANNLRLMAQCPTHPRHQQSRNLISLLVYSVSRLA